MEFKSDSKKSESNKAKHGIDFETAKAIWNDEGAYIATVFRDDEPRFIVVGMIESTLWTAVITYRGEKIRIISVRRSRSKEVETYDQFKEAG